MLVIFSGGSGAGKNSVIEELRKTGEFALMPTYTTREKRENEKEGNPYCYIDEKTLMQKADSGELYEYQNVHGHYYATSRRLLKETLALGKILLKDIDVVGTQRLLENIDDVKIVTVFVKVSSKKVLLERLKKRKETEIETRLSRYDFEMSFKERYDYIVDNEDLKETTALVYNIIQSEKLGKKPLDAEDGKIDDAEIEKNIETLNEGGVLEPVKIAEKGGEFYIVSGKNRYLAGLYSGKRVAKEIVEAAAVSVSDQKPWADALKKAEK